LFCRRQHIPVAAVDSAESPFFHELLTHWANQLKIDRVVFPAFQATLKRYHDLQSTVSAKESTQDRAKEPLGVTNAEVYNAWLNSFLSPTNVKLFLDPTEQLTNDFLRDLTQDGKRERLVLMIDIQTQTQDSQQEVSALDDWLCS